MSTYEVTWRMHVDADSPLEAAQIALEVHRDKNSTATVFEVDDVQYDAASPTTTHKVYVETDCDPINPRADHDNIGVMHCRHKRYTLGDAGAECPYDDPFSPYRTLKDHVMLCRPLYLMDHSGLALSHAPFQCPLDSGLVGWHYVTKQTMQENWPNEAEDALLSHANRVLDNELECYAAFVSNDIYCVCVEDERGDNIQSVGGFYGESAADDACAHFDEIYADAIRDAFDSYGEKFTVEVPRGHS